MIRFFLAAIAICAIMVEFSALEIGNKTCGVTKSDQNPVGNARGAYPWVVALLYTGTEPPLFYCGGTLISKTFVISGKKFKIIH